MTVTDAVSMHLVPGVPSEILSEMVNVPTAVQVNVAPVVDRLLSVPEVVAQTADKGAGPLSGS
jgi:hypothetical protein